MDATRIEHIAKIERLTDSVGACLKEVEEARPVLNLLREADHPGAEWADCEASGTLERGCGSTLRDLHDALLAFCAAKGDQAAVDFEFYSRYLNKAPDAAAEAMVTSDGGNLDLMTRALAMRQYAATVAYR